MPALVVRDEPLPIVKAAVLSICLLELLEMFFHHTLLVPLALVVLAAMDIKPYPNYCFFIQEQAAVVVLGLLQAGWEVLAVTVVVAVAVVLVFQAARVDEAAMVWL
jgi:uncharacterized membrane protein YqjE